MKILQVVTHFDMGGAERIAINISKSRNPDFEYHIVEVVKGDSSYTPAMLKELEENGIRYYCSNISSSKLGILLFPFRMKKLMEIINPDVVHVHTEIPDLGVYLFHKLFPFNRFKLVRTLHNTLLWQSWKSIGEVVERYVQKERANVSNSLAVTKAYEENYGSNAGIPLIYNGFAPSEQYSFDGIQESLINILFAGRFVPQKGLSTLIEVIKKCKLSNIHFYVAGQGPLEVDLKSQLSDLDNVSIIPPISNLAHYVGAFDYVIITSIHEGLNSLSIEASMNGTPCIVNDIDGLNETLPDDWPLKVQNNSVEQYLTILDKISEKKEYEVLKAKAYSFVQEHFSIERMQEQYELLYENKSK